MSEPGSTDARDRGASARARRWIQAESKFHLLAGALAVTFLVGFGGVVPESARSSRMAPTSGGRPPSVPVETLPSVAAPAAQNALEGAVSRRIRVAAGSVGQRSSRLAVLVQGKQVPIRNGGRIELAGGLSAEIFVDPYPPARSELWLDLRLTRTSSGHPVTRARATMTYEMRVMTHGVNTAAVRSTGGGHYVATARYPMFGDWGHRVRIQVGRTVHELNLVVGIVPG